MYRFLSRQQDESNKLVSIARKHGIKEFLNYVDDLEFAQRLWNTQTWELHSGWPSYEMLEDPGSQIVKDPRVIDPDILLEGARQNLKEFNYIGFTESFENDIRAIFSDLGAPNITVPYSNASPPVENEVDSKSLALIKEITALDHMIVEDARKLMQARYSARN